VAKTAPNKSNTRFFGALVLIGLAGIGILGYALARPATPIKPVDPNLPAGTAQGYLLGNPDAPVRVMEFADFECPGCAQWSAITEPDVRARLIQTGQVAFYFFDFPLDSHRNSWPASNAVACAADQGKTWEMHDRVLETQFQWNTQATANPRSVLRRIAGEIGVDTKAWEECFDSQKHYPRIKANLEEGVKRGVRGTPSFVIGGMLMPFEEAMTYDRFKAYVDTAAAAAAAAAKQPRGAKAAGKSAP
jgi:protein-disulfide isomerase